MRTDAKFGDSIEKLRAGTTSPTAERLKTQREARVGSEREEKVTLESQPGQIESAIARGTLDLKKEYIDPKDGKIDEVRLEELVLKLTESVIHPEVIPADVAKDMAHVIEGMIDSPEFAVQKDQLAEMLGELRAVEAPRAKAETEAKLSIVDVDVDSFPAPIEVKETITKSLEVEDVLARATELGYPQLEGVLSIDIEDAADDIKNIKDKLAKEHRMSASDVDKAANGTLKIGFFGRFGGLLFGKTAHKNALIAKLGEKSTMMRDYARLEADATAKVVNQPAAGKKRALPNLSDKYAKQSRSSGVSVGGVTPRG
ncbi:hypothetical protein KJ673_00110 [Patescibacteria group bacterium]|nr:hypothetical protein [Patescibacteria group bacterium]MBU4452644.1 hypothetical protein [Patescibacteria group bacterium]MCG2687391.1 hypothetical protein [Candidatus Parcubacteria bacterium]